MLKRLIMFMVGCFVPLRRGQLEGRTNILSRGKQTALFLLTLIMCLFLQVQPSWSATTLYGAFAGGGIWGYDGTSWTQATPNTPTMMAVSGSTLYGAFSGGGIWQYNGTTWSQVTPNTPTIMTAASNTCTVTFNLEGGSGVSSQQVVSGGTLSSLPTPIKSGYTFGGWYTSTSYTTAFTTSTIVTGNITVYAKWTSGVTGTGTASGTYTWNSGTSTLTFDWTSSTFICNGPGTDTETGVTIGTTTMTWVSSKNNMTWTRSSGTAGNPAGTWTATQNGETYTAVITAANSTSGTVSISAPIIACSSDDLNPSVGSQYNPGNSGYIYTIGDARYKDTNHTASAVSVTGSGITGSATFTYNNGEWNPANWPLSNFGNTQPTLPLTYTYQITDTSTWTSTVVVHCFMTLVVSNLSPTGTITTTTPTFTWTGIGTSDAVYYVWVNDSNNNQIWEQDSITGTSVVYNGPALTAGATYSYGVGAQSRSNCLDGNSQVNGSFTYNP